MKKIMALICLSLSAMVLVACAHTHDGQVGDQAQDFHRTGTPSPLNTSANPWTNVNPQVQAQMRAGAIGGR